MACDWLIRGSHDFLGEISGDFHHIFTTSWVFTWHLFTTFSLHFMTFSRQIFTTWNFHDIFSLHFHYKFSLQRDEQTGTNRLHRDTQTDFHHGFSPQIYTTDFHHGFSLQISLSWERDLGDEQTKISLETVASSNILIYSSSNSVDKGCTDKFSPHVVKMLWQSEFSPRSENVVKIWIFTTREKSEFSPRSENVVKIWIFTTRSENVVKIWIFTT